MTSTVPALTPRSFLARGLLAGLITGFAVFAVSYIAGESFVDAAIAVEESTGAHSHGAEAADAHSHGAETADEEIVSRDNQRSWGLLTASLALSVTLGGVAALGAAFAYGRLGRRLTPTLSTAAVVVIGFVAVGLVPFLIYPANPPAVGDPETINIRTAAYFGLIALSLIGAVGAVILAVRVAARTSGYLGVLVGTAAYVLLILAAALLLPDAAPVGDFPADTLWGFRRAALLTQLVLWCGLGFTLAGMIERLHRQVQVAEARRELVASL